MPDLELLPERSIPSRAFEKGVWLILWEAQMQPPHLMLAVNNTFFSLDAKGKTIAAPLTPLTRAIARRKIGALWIELLPPLATKSAMELATSAFETTAVLEAGKQSCLAPILSFCESYYSFRLRGVSFVFDLIPVLQAAHQIGTVYQQNLTSFLEESGAFRLRHYAQNEVDARIDSALGANNE